MRDHINKGHLTPRIRAQSSKLFASKILEGSDQYMAALYISLACLPHFFDGFGELIGVFYGSPATMGAFKIFLSPRLPCFVNQLAKLS